MAMQQTFQSMVLIAALLIGSAGLNGQAASDAQRLNSKDIEGSSNINAETRSEPGGMRQFTIDIKLSDNASSSAHLRGRLEVYDNQQLIVSSEVKNARPAPPSKQRRRLDAKPDAVELTFSVHDRYVQGSRFYLTYVYPEIERTSTYWVMLTDLVESP